MKVVNDQLDEVPKGLARAFTLLAVLQLASLDAFAPRAHAQGGIPLWTNHYNGAGNSFDLTRAVAVDIDGNVFITGSSIATNGLDYATVAYSSTGLPLWTNLYNGPANLH